MGSYSKRNNQDSVKTPFATTPNFARVVEEKKPPDLGKTRHTGEDNLTALKNYRRSKGVSNVEKNGDPTISVLLLSLSML